MTAETRESLNGTAELNPYVTNLASRLMQTAARAELPMDSTGWQLITEVLSYAASAEQRLSEQQTRINYLEQLSVTDELTGITNRRGLKQALARLLAASARHKEEGVLAFFDLDDFKAINDRHGHMAGDAALRHMAYILKQQTRSGDVVARISGDEFAVILARCNPEQGLERLNILQSKINETPFGYSDMLINIACSVGCCPFKAGADPSLLIEAADQAMYSNKLKRKRQ